MRGAIVLISGSMKVCHLAECVTETPASQALESLPSSARHRSDFSPSIQTRRTFPLAALRVPRDAKSEGRCWPSAWLIAERISLGIGKPLQIITPFEFYGEKKRLEIGNCRDG